MEKAVKSKGWDWSKVSGEHFSRTADEFLPVALRWRELGKKTVLDLGCGRGRHSLFLAEMGFDVTATDISPQGITQLKEEAGKRGLDGKIKTLVCDMLELPFPAKSFDAVLAFLSITHTDYAGLQKAIARVADMLTPSGRFYVTFNSKSSDAFNHPSNKKIDSYTIIKQHGLEKDIPHTYLERDDIISLLAGFEILKMQQIQDYYDTRISTHFFVEAEKKN
ncbi:MAG: class I SAM-dependent methyltransferase [Dehalococcoidales bacterium]